ncbi:UNVERIFIED_CONTAM: hypothetical protein RMT77_000505 [Armadillidium vulgare]
MFLLILSTLLACSHIFIAPVIAIIMNIISKETSMEKQMKAEVVDLKKQLQTVNMVDQFPVYAKLQRKINAQTTRYKEKLSERKSAGQKFKFFLNILFQGLTALCSFILIWNFRSSPVASMPDHLIWPLGHVLSLPSCRPGEISVIVWLPLVRTACGRFSKLIHK